MVFLVMWKDISIAFLSCSRDSIRYNIIFKNLNKALRQGMIYNSILQNTTYKGLPDWIKNRIPEREENKLEYLKRTEGRLETDNFWFKCIID